MATDIMDISKTEHFEDSLYSTIWYLDLIAPSSSVSYMGEERGRENLKSHVQYTIAGVNPDVFEKKT